MTRLGQFSLLASAEREAVLEARDQALGRRIARVSALASARRVLPCLPRDRSGDGPV
jgi:hypothetical protein